jgi:hypothetical protein
MDFYYIRFGTVSVVVEADSYVEALAKAEEWRDVHGLSHGYEVKITIVNKA